MAMPVSRPHPMCLSIVPQARRCNFQPFVNQIPPAQDASPWQRTHQPRSIWWLRNTWSCGLPDPGHLGSTPLEGWKPLGRWAVWRKEGT